MNNRQGRALAQNTMVKAIGINSKFIRQLKQTAKNNLRHEFYFVINAELIL
jgi:hypothetical protein